MQESTHDPLGRLGANHPTVITVIDVLIVAGIKTRADAETALDNMPPSYGTLTADERAVVLNRFDS